jgi:hypothetical protein
MFEVLGDAKSALLNYERSFFFNPDNEDAGGKIKALTKD